DSSVAGNGLTDVRRTVRADRDGDEPRIMSTLRNEVALLSEQSRVVVLTERLRIVDGIEGDHVLSTTNPGASRVQQNRNLSRVRQQISRLTGQDVEVVHELRVQTQIGEPGRDLSIRHGEHVDTLTASEVRTNEIGRASCRARREASVER